MNAPMTTGLRQGALAVRDLRIDFMTRRGMVRAVDGVDFNLPPGTSLGIVGESGSGKSVTALAIMGLLPSRQVRMSGEISFGGNAVTQLGAPRDPGLRGREIAMVFQDAGAALNPVLDIVSQVAEAYEVHLGQSAVAARREALAMLKRVGIGNLGHGPVYPHRYSGGMRQRAIIAMALAARPRLLIADEPTTALDVTVQAQVLDLIRQLTSEQSSSLMLISHDLGVVAGMVDRIAVMYAGRIVEIASTKALFEQPLHPYTAGLMRCIPRLDRPRPLRLGTIKGLAPGVDQLNPGCPFAPRCERTSERCLTEAPRLDTVMTGRQTACWHWDRPPAKPAIFRSVEPLVGEKRDVLLSARNLQVEYGTWHNGRRVRIRPVDGIDLTIRAGETLGLVGESGCGKSTLGRSLLQLTSPKGGKVTIAGEDWTTASRRRLRALRRQAQMIFQDPFETLDPKLTIGASLLQAIRTHPSGSGEGSATDRAMTLLKTVELPSHLSTRLPRECSGGQLQRVAIARALAVSPQLIVADEPTSSLDVSVQAQMVNLLVDLQERLGLTYLFISHNLSVVRQIAARVAVMYMGQIIELATRDRIFFTPQHPYTQALIAAVPVPDPARQRAGSGMILRGDVADIAAPPSGCRFHPRCPLARDICRSERPLLRGEPDHRVACHLVSD